MVIVFENVYDFFPLQMHGTGKTITQCQAGSKPGEKGKAASAVSRISV